MPSQFNFGRAVAFSALLWTSAALANPAGERLSFGQPSSAGAGAERIEGGICQVMAQDKKEPERQLGKPAENKAEAHGRVSQSSPRTFVLWRPSIR